MILPLTLFYAAAAVLFFYYFISTPATKNIFLDFDYAFALCSERDVEDLVARDANDGSILAGRLYELRNGCVCCTIKDSLAVTLEALLEERHLYQHIVIELTGLADPGPVASRLWLDDAMHSRLKLDGMRIIVL